MSISVYDKKAHKNSQLHIGEVGNPASDRQLVLLHGLGGNAEQFSHLIELIDHGVYLIKITLPGHDRNVLEDPELKPSFDSLCDLVIDHCDTVGIRSAHFCGISMGSAIALKIAAKRPELCKSLIVVRPAWLTEEQPKNLRLIGLIGDWFADHSADRVLELLEESPEFKDLTQDVPGAAQSLRGVVNRPQAERHSIVLNAIFRDAPFRRLNELRNVHCSVVVIGTNADPLHPVELARQTANALPNARLEILPPRYLDPEAYEAAFLRVVGEVLNIPNGDPK